MSTVKLEMFLNDVMPDVPGCDLPIALHAIRSSAIEFCERTLIVKVDLDQETVVAGERYFDLAPPDSSTIIARVMSIRVDGKGVEPKTESELNAWSDTWRTDVGPIRYYTGQSPYQVIWVAVPDTAYTVDMTVALAPKAEATSVDRILYDKYREAIAHGAKYRLKMMAGKPWSDSQGALYCKGLFDLETGTASLVAAKGFTKAPLRAATSV